MSLYKSIKIGSLELSGNLFLAPVAGYTDRAFRSICSELGASFAFTELVSAEAFYRNHQRYESNTAAANLVRRGESERKYAIQLFAGESDSIYKAACLLAPFKPDAVDINAGCPVPKVVKNGAGSALMKNPAKLGQITEAAVRASRESLGDIPVTVKIRSGWDSASANYAECARIAADAGAAMISLHPRTRSQGYGGRSEWRHIADLVTRLSVPVTGSGDLYSPEDAHKMLSETGCAAVMFARGAMGNPFIFPNTQAFLETGAYERQETIPRRLALVMRHLEMLACDIGERTACLEMRKQFCAYTKGLNGGAALREKAVHAQTIDEYRKIIDEYK